MQKQLFFAVLTLCCAPAAYAQNDRAGQKSANPGESAFTFTEAQLGEDENVSQNVPIISSNSNVYTSEVGYLFSPVRFRYRALDQKYNEIFINGAPVNDMETGQFRFSLVGGLNQQTRNLDSAMPFEGNNFSLSSLGGSSNYDFRPADMAAGSRITLSGANRNYTLRGMYTYNSGLTSKGWAWSANITYRWANRGYVKGTFYNALSYFFGVQKLIGNHSLAFSTWGTPTERASQGASTDEMYWLANSYTYNPYWGYQNGKVRNSRVVNDYSPSAVLTWDWKMSEKSKLTTSLFGKYGMYKGTKLNYSNSENPSPDYYKRLPSNYYDVWNRTNAQNTFDNYLQFVTARNYLAGTESARQIDWDRLYYANRNASKQGADAMYYVQAKHNDVLNLTLSSVYNTHPTKNSTLNFGFNVGTNKGKHYQTMDDLLGATSFHNINYYASGNFAEGSDKLQYDLNNPNAEVKKDDKFGYDYDILVNRGQVWTSYSENIGFAHYLLAGRLGFQTIQRKGYMRNGLFADNSYGKSKTSKFADGGIKGAVSFNMGHGNTLSLGLGYEHRAPQGKNAFIAPEMNNDFALDLRNERVFSSEIGYQYMSPWLHANINAYYSYITHATDWTCFYFDDINSFSYNSITGLSKKNYGVEAGLDFKVTSALDFKLIGTMSNAKNASNAHVVYLNSTEGSYHSERALIKNMHESGTPLTAASAGVSYHQSGWYLDLNGNYYDRIYLSYSPYYRYESVAKKNSGVSEDYSVVSTMPQAKGHGGFMVDGSIGRSIWLKHGSLSINLMVSNILNNRTIVTGGYEQSRSDYSASGSERTYKFSHAPKKFYAYGTNGMLNIAYKF